MTAALLRMGRVSHRGFNFYTTPPSLFTQGVVGEIFSILLGSEPLWA